MDGAENLNDLLSNKTGHDKPPFAGGTMTFVRICTVTS